MNNICPICRQGYFIEGQHWCPVLREFLPEGEDKIKMLEKYIELLETELREKNE